MSIIVLQSSRWGKRELVALFCMSSWCLVIVVWLFLMMPRVCVQFVIVVFPDHTHIFYILKKASRVTEYAVMRHTMMKSL